MVLTSQHMLAVSVSRKYYIREMEAGQGHHRGQRHNGQHGRHRSHMEPHEKYGRGFCEARHGGFFGGRMRWKRKMMMDMIENVAEQAAIKVYFIITI